VLESNNSAKNLQQPGDICNFFQKNQVFSREKKNSAGKNLALVVFFWFFLFLVVAIAFELKINWTTIRSSTRRTSLSLVLTQKLIFSPLYCNFETKKRSKSSKLQKT